MNARRASAARGASVRRTACRFAALLAAAAALVLLAGQPVQAQNAPPTNLQVFDIDATNTSPNRLFNFKVSWQIPAGSPDGYRFRLREQGATPWAVTSTSDFLSTTLTTDPANSNRRIVSAFLGQADGYALGDVIELQIGARFGTAAIQWSSTVTFTLALSNDATLQRWAVRGGTSASGTFTVLLGSDTFNSATLSYSVSVVNSITHVKLTPIRNQSGATMKVGKRGSTLTSVLNETSSAAIALSVGANDILVEVTAQDGTTRKTYTATVSRAATSTLRGEIWSATLTPNLFTSFGIGCTNTATSSTQKCSNTVALTDDDFTLGGSTYTFRQIFNNSGTLYIDFTSTISATLKTYQFCVGASSFALSSATLSTVGGATNSRATWSSTGLTWTAGTAVPLKIASSCTIPAIPSVSISAAPNPVPEGSSVTITATLSSALAADVRIPLTVTRGTAEEGDFGSQAAISEITITIPSGQTSASEAISTMRDIDGDDETFTVALDSSLPQSVTAGSPNSVAITITDIPADKTAPTDVTVVFDRKRVSLQTRWDFDITWSKQSNADSYQVQARKRGASQWITDTPTVSDVPGDAGKTTTKIPLLASHGVGDNIEVDFRVAAVYGTGQSAIPVWSRLVRSVANPSTPSLFALTASGGTSASGTFTAFALNPAVFTATTTAYSASVASSVTHLKLTPTAGQKSATLQVGLSGSLTSVNSGADSAAIPLSVGANAVLVEVTAADGTTKNTYTLTITRAAAGAGSQSSNANLSALTAKSSTDGSTFTALALTPAFSASTTAYRASVGNEVTHAIVTPTTAHNAASIQVGKSGSLTAVSSGSDSAAVSLSVGSNRIQVEVTAEDGSTRDYFVTITRAASPATPTVSLSVSSTRVREGDSVTVTARLSKALGSDEDIRIAWVTGESDADGFFGSAEEDDVAPDSFAIAIPTGATTGTGTFTTTRDTDNEDDSFTIEVQEAVLPSGVALGSPHLVLVTIEDIDPSSLTLSPAAQRVSPGGTAIFTALLDKPAPADTEVTLTLTDPSGNPLADTSGTYTLAPPSPLTITGGARSTTATFTASENAVIGTVIRLRASAPSSPDPLTDTSVITIGSQTPAELLHQTALPEVARAVAGRVTGAISTRVGRALNGGGSGGSGGASASLGGQSTLAGALKTHAPGVVNKNRSLRDLLHGSDFVLPFHTRREGGGLRKTSLWGSGEYRNLSGENDGVDFAGSLYGAQIGVDAKVRENLLAGVALSWSEGELEYEDANTGGGAGAVNQGDYEIDIQAVHPYLGWRSGSINWWATIGYGTGEVEITPNDGESSTNDVTLQSVSLGGSGLLWSRNDADLRLKGEITQTEMEVEKSDQVAAVEVETTLIRFAAEASSTRRLNGDGQLSPSISLGLRHDGGDGVDGNLSTGAEFHGAVRYANPKTGWNAETSVHTLLGRSDYEEWGIQASLRLSPSVGGHGLSFEMRPGYGNHGGRDGDNGTEQIWSNGLNETTPTTHDPSGRLEMNLGYGLSTPGERDGLLTPWSGLTLHDNGKLYRLGLDWASGGPFPFTLRLHGERREHGNERTDADHAVVLKGEARF